jgi:hypothetical protein
MRIGQLARSGSAIVTVVVMIASAHASDWPFGWKAQPGAPTTLTQIARSIDDVEHKILDDGVVVVKQPDVWGQSRMTLYRKDFETMMKARGPDDFQAVLSARIARLDAAALQSQTSLSASLAGQGGGGSGRRPGARGPATGSASAVTSPTVVAFQNPAGGGQAQGKTQGDGGGGGVGGPGVPADQFWNVQPLPTDSPYSLLPNKQPFSDMDSKYGGKLGLDPPVFLDEKKRFFDHLNQIRRVNIGDDNADSAGYGLYLVRMPISIQPGECTLKGHGAILTVTARPEFNSNNFLKDTFRDLVINDVVDQLGPIVFELIRGGLVQVMDEHTEQLKNGRELYFYQRAGAAQEAEDVRRLKDALDADKRRNDHAREAALSKIADLARHVPDSLAGLADTIAKGMPKSGGIQILTDETKPDSAGFNARKLVYEPSEQPPNLKAAVRSDALSAIAEALSTLRVAAPGPRRPLERTSAATIIERLRQSAKEVQTKLGQFKPNDTAGARSFSKLDTDLNGVVARLDELYVEESKPGEATKPLLDVKKLVNNLKSVGRGGLGGGGVLALLDPSRIGVELSDQIEKIEQTGLKPSQPPAPRPNQPRDLKAELEYVALEYYFEAKTKIDEIVKAINSANQDAIPVNGYVVRAHELWIGSLDTRVEPFLKRWNRILRGKLEGISPDDVSNLASDLRGILDDFEPFVRDDVLKNAPEQLGRLRAEFTELNERSSLLEKRREAAQKELDKYANPPKELAAQASVIRKVHSALQIERVASLAFPSTRFGGRAYPVAPSEIGDVYLKDGIFTLVRKTQESLQTETARATDVRNYLRHELLAAYDLIEYYQAEIEEITQAIQDQHDYGRLGRELFPMLVARLPGDLKNQPDNPVSILCWCVAVEAGLLNRHLQKDISETQIARGSNIADASYVSTLRFYEKNPAPEAEETFEHYVKARWPMIVFALDPFVDEQNIADAFSLRRDLQLAMAFAFSTGKINFNQLIQYNRKIEQDAETIALNRTVTSFSHGTDTFGWRFYPRYQNPPAERSNVQTITNLLWRGGPGRNYQMNNSKLEPGQRELTAVIIMPSFLQRVRFDITGNWFPLHDPDQIKVRTARMLEEGQKVVELRQSLATAVECAQYRADDIERLVTRVDQLEAMLAMQTRRVNVPYENSLGGFELFTHGTTALVPEVTGFEGVESIEQDKPTDILIFGRHFSLHETKVVVGGQILVPDDTNPTTFATLGQTQVDIVSREVIHLKLPGGVRPSKIRSVADRDLARTNPQLTTKRYVELYLATPNGISNRLLIPYTAKAVAPEATTAEPSLPANHAPIELQRGYVVLDDTFKIQGRLPAGANPGVETVAPAAGEKPAAKTSAPRPGTPSGVKPLEYPEWEMIRIMPTKPPTTEAETIDVELHFPIDGDVSISVSVSNLPYRDGAYVISGHQLTKLAGEFLNQLESYGRVIGDKRVSASSSSEILVTPTGSHLPPTTTYNPLNVKVIVFTSARDEQPTPPAAPAAAPGSDVTPEIGAAGARATPATAPAPTHPSLAPSPGPSAPKGSATPGSGPASSKRPTSKNAAEKGSSSIDRPRRLPAAATADAAVVRARQVTERGTTMTSADRSSDPPLPPPSPALLRTASTARAPATAGTPVRRAQPAPGSQAPASTEPQPGRRRSLLSRFMGGP